MAQQPGAGGNAQGNWLTSLMPLVVIFAIFYFLLIRPQQKQQKKVKEMLGNVKRGDEVLTRGGIYGRIHGIADNIITLEVAENVKIKMSRESIAAVVNQAAATAN
jgi:preprotein translocase subunit YajC